MSSRLRLLGPGHTGSVLEPEEQIVCIFAGTHGFLDPLPTHSIDRYQTELISWIKAERPSILTDIVSKGKIDDTLESQLEDALKAFAQVFEPTQDA